MCKSILYIYFILLLKFICFSSKNDKNQASSINSSKIGENDSIKQQLNIQLRKYKYCSNDMLNKNQQAVSNRSDVIVEKSPMASFTKLSDTRINKHAMVTLKDNLLTVENLFRDLDLDYDEDVKKLDEIENLKKLYKMKQDEILKSIEIKNLLSIFRITRQIHKKHESPRVKVKHHFESNIERKKLLFKKLFGEKLIKTNFKLNYMNLNGNHMLIIKKLNKITQMNPVCCSTNKYKFINKCNNQRLPFFHLFSLILNSYYLNFSLIIGLQKVKLSLNVRDIKRKKTNMKNKTIKKSKTDNRVIIKHFKKAETSGNIETNNLPKNLLDEYYEKYCETTQNPNSLKISKSLKIKRSKTEEKLNEVSREQVRYDKKNFDFLKI